MEEDCIVSLNCKNEYLKITIMAKEEQQYFYKALIVEDHFSQKLKDLIGELWECVDLFSMSLVDDLEEEIKKYNLVLQKSKTKIFSVELKNDCVTFFSKYPTSNGFLDDYPCQMG